MNKFKDKQWREIQWFEKHFFNAKLGQINSMTVKRLFYGDGNNGLLNLMKEGNSHLAKGQIVSLMAKLLD